jgi:hypothetical protein
VAAAPGRIPARRGPGFPRPQPHLSAEGVLLDQLHARKDNQDFFYSMRRG